VLAAGRDAARLEQELVARVSVLPEMGVGSQQADVAAQSIAAQAGAPVTPERFNPMIHGMLLTDRKPVYLTAHLTGGHGVQLRDQRHPHLVAPNKIAAKYLAPYLATLDRERAPAH
jgi:hypothetical protein